MPDPTAPHDAAAPNPDRVDHSGRASGFLIALEGIDGSGKTEQSRRLADWLRERGHRVLETREPTEGSWGRRYREWARGAFEADASQVLEFFLEDRKEHVQKVLLPALAENIMVVCDRYVASTLAYQAAAGVERAMLHARTFESSPPAADLTLWLRLPVAQALERIQSERLERYERATFLSRVDAEYAALGLCEVDATAAPDQVAAQIRRIVAAAVARRGASAGKQRNAD